MSKCIAGGEDDEEVTVGGSQHLRETPPDEANLSVAHLPVPSFGRLSLNPLASEFVPGGGSGLWKVVVERSNCSSPQDLSARAAGVADSITGSCALEEAQHHSSDGELAVPATQERRLDWRASPFAPGATRLWSPSGPDLTDSSSAVSYQPSLFHSHVSDDEYRRYWREELPSEVALLAFDDGHADLLASSSELCNGYEEPQLAERAGLGVSLGSGPVSHQSGSPFAGVPVPEHRPGIAHQFSIPSIREEASFPMWPPEEYPQSGHFTEGTSVSDKIWEEDAVRILEADFPGFAVETLAELFSVNRGDLWLTSEMLTQLEVQEKGSPLPQYANSHAQKPSLSPIDFPALPLDASSALPPSCDPCTSNSSDLMVTRPPQRAALLAEGGPDFAAIVRKQAQQQMEIRGSAVDLGHQGGARGNLSSRPGLGGADRRGKHGGGDKLATGLEGGPARGQGPSSSPAWLETGEAVAGQYAEAREEASGHARARNAFFQQAVKAFQAGNKALARELSAKGKWHNERMQEAHSSASNALFTKRNTATGYLDSQARGSGTQVLDLHGLHVSEAITKLRRELSGVRAAVHRTGHHQQLCVCVGTGHHTKGRTRPRLPAAVEQYFEEEHVQFREATPGMLQVYI